MIVLSVIILSQVEITYCAGACDSYDSSTIYSIDGETIVHDHECKCCTGEGELEELTVNCGSRKRQIKIKKFHTCGCNRCEGEGETCLLIHNTNTTNMI